MSDKQKLQWVKGDNQGTVESIAEQKDEWTYFQSGRRIKTELLNEFLIPINHEEQLLNIPGMNTPGKSSGNAAGYAFESADEDDVIRDADGNEFRKPRTGPMINADGEQVATKTQVQRTQQIEAPKPVKKESPITLLINQSKKDSVKVNYQFNVEIPKADVYKIIENSFDVEDLDQEILDVVLEKIDIKEMQQLVNQSIKEAIKSHYKSKNK